MRCKFCDSDQEEEENMVVTFWCDTDYDKVDDLWVRSAECQERERVSNTWKKERRDDHGIKNSKSEGV